MTIAAPSYLMPGTWLENLRGASAIEWLRGVELLFFVYDEDARRILREERGGIADFASRFSLSLHLPDPISDADEELVELTRPFVGLYVLHPPKQRGDAASDRLCRWTDLLGRWRARYGDVFALEYTGASDFAAVNDRAFGAMPGLPLCPDSGRLLLDGEDPRAWVEERADRVAQLHIHAARDGSDHHPLSARDAWLPAIARMAADRSWRVNLELFSAEAATASYQALIAALGDFAATKEVMP